MQGARVQSLVRELEALGKELEHLSHIKESVEDKVFACDMY